MPADGSGVIKSGVEVAVAGPPEPPAVGWPEAAGATTHPLRAILDEALALRGQAEATGCDPEDGNRWLGEPIRQRSNDLLSDLAEATPFTPADAAVKLEGLLADLAEDLTSNELRSWEDAVREAIRFLQAHNAVPVAEPDAELIEIGRKVAALIPEEDRRATINGERIRQARNAIAADLGEGDNIPSDHLCEAYERHEAGLASEKWRALDKEGEPPWRNDSRRSLRRKPYGWFARAAAASGRLRRTSA